MRKVHIALVGGQPAPVFYGIYATKPENVVFVYSSESKKLIQQIKESLKSFHIDCNYENSLPLAPNDAESIIKRAEELKEEHWNDQVVINISSGTKPWAYLISKVFANHPDVTIIFIDQINRLWNYSDNSYSQIDPINDVVQHLALYGSPLIEYTSFSDYTVKDNDVANRIEKIRRINPEDFNELAAKLTRNLENKLKYQKDGRWKTSSGSYVEWCKATSTEPAWARIVFVKKDKPTNEFLLESEHVINLLFNSGWFEYKVAKILSKWQNARQILMNCRFKSKSSNNLDKNEVDIIVRTDNRILFVECKTKLSQSTDIDKFRSDVKTYGGSACHGIFITDVPMTDLEKEKCSSHQLLEPIALSLLSSTDELYSRLDQALTLINL